jgi:hypothetical protein
MLPWRGPQYRVIQIRRDGTRMPLPVMWGRLEGATQSARVRWIGNKDPDIAGYGVSDGTKIVFSAPACAEREDPDGF